MTINKSEGRYFAVLFQYIRDNSPENVVISDNDTVIMLQNDNNIRVIILTYGAAILEVRTPDRRGNFKNIALSLASTSHYRKSPSYAGATLGPNAGRIPGGRLPIGDYEYSLTQNDGSNQLHGGYSNFSDNEWHVEQVGKDTDQVWLTLSLTAADGLDGYPGNREISVTYTLNNSNSLTISFRAKSDKPTWMNLSNHTYWNLSGDFTQPATIQFLHIHAEEVLYNDNEHLPMAFHPVDGTPFDFRKSACIENRLEAFPGDQQTSLSRGYNNAFALAVAKPRPEPGSGSGSGQVLRPAATLTDPESGRRMTLSTDYPSLVMYSGGFLDESIILAGGAAGSPGCAIALEAQEFPDALHLADVPHPVVYPGEEWRRTIRFTFDLTDHME